MKILFEFEKKPLYLEDPVKIISCYHPARLNACFDMIESALACGLTVAGFCSYEAGYAFEKKLWHDKQDDFPLLYMGCYRAPTLPGAYSRTACGPYALNDIVINTAQDKYFKDIDAIRRYIACGDVYQITYCIKMRFRWDGDAFGLYRALYRMQPVPYPAYLETDRFRILSLSPEMFLKKSGSFIKTKPMKGTWPRGSNPISDLAAGLRLHFDKKNRAENLMITDLLRNDLGRCGKDIAVPVLFEVAQYNLLYQMTSTVTATVREDIPVRELFASVFPSGSVTGAPKIRAMEIIRELENEERRIYTGAIGYILPNRDMFFNIPIRTLLLRDGTGEMGIGGGIVWDSTPQGEWDEGMLKSQFLMKTF
ncbi:MAG: aminodeoxychorismate synthase component I [Candidatus Omnitrophica bacterium]|nr:aminodeoxychorismate synthase component I [Candidatus Omnitrophota bacterium]